MNLICGLNPVLEALQAGSRHFDRLIVVKGLRNQRVSEAISRASRLGVPLRFESRETLDRMAGGIPHQGVIAVVSAKPTIGLDELLAHARQPALLVALDGVEDPRNLGAILRTCEAAGADGVLLPQRHSAGLTETVGRASAGALEHIRVARVGNLAQAVEELKARGLWVIGFDASGSERWNQVDYQRPVALVLGGEGRGIRRLVRERCDQVASIPLFGQVASLNVSVAAGVALYEAVRQRGVVPTHVKPIPPRAAPPQARIEGPTPGDTTPDPGAAPAAVTVWREGADQAGADESGADGEAAYPINVVRHFDEDVAWGPALASSGPAEARGRDRERGSRRGGERGDGRSGDARRQQEPGAAQVRDPSGGRSAFGAPPRPGPRSRRGGRQRRRPAPPRGDGAPGAAPTGMPPRPVSSEPRPAAEPPPDDAAAAPGPEAGNAPGGSDAAGRQRRRRWRRRRGTKPVV